MRYTRSEKREIIRIVEQSELSVNKTLKELSVNRSSFYRWYQRYQKYGLDGLINQDKGPKRVWNKIPEQVKQMVVETALDKAEMSPRELAWHITDTTESFISKDCTWGSSL